MQPSVQATISGWRSLVCQTVFLLFFSLTPLQASSNTISPNLPDAAKRLFFEAREMLGQGNFERPRAAVLQGLRLSPQSVDGYNLLGIIYSQQKDYTQSLNAFQQALKLDPRSGETHNNLGKSYFAQQKFESAAREFRAAMHLEPRHRDAIYHLGLVLLEQGHPEQAIEFFQQVPSPDNGVSLNLTQAYLRSGQVAKGLELARKGFPSKTRQTCNFRAPDLAPVNRTVVGKRNEPEKGCGGTGEGAKNGACHKDNCPYFPPG